MHSVGESVGNRVNRILSELNKTDAAVISSDDYPRVLPTRQCKNCTVSDWVPRKRKLTTEGKSRKGPKLKRSKWRKPTALESIQLLEKLKQAALGAAQAKRRPCLRISTRTVELVDQTREQWREESSKLLFIVGLGLTPIPNSPAVPLPYIKLVSTSLEKIQRESEETTAENAFKIARRKERVQRFQRIRSWRFALALVGRVEVIDLTTSDDDNESKVEQTTTRTQVQKREPYYYNLTKEITSTLHTRQLQSQTSERFLANKISCPTNITDRALTISNTMNIIHQDSSTPSFFSK